MKRKRRKKKQDGMLLATILLFILLGSIFQNSIIIILLLLALLPVSNIAWNIIQKRRQEERYLSSGMRDVDNLTGEEFEYFLCEYFKALEYQAKVTPKVNDYGADVIAEKDGEKIVVQAKRYKGKVGIKAVQEIIGARNYYKADKAMVITSAFFTPNAKELAAASEVDLWDRDKLKSVMEQVQGKRLVDDVKQQEEFKAIERVCPVCGGHLITRTGKHGQFYGCENYPDCQYTKPL